MWQETAATNDNDHHIFTVENEKRNIFENNGKKLVGTNGTQNEEKRSDPYLYALPIINSSFIRPAIYFNTPFSCGVAVCAARTGATAATDWPRSVTFHNLLGGPVDGQAEFRDIRPRAQAEFYGNKHQIPFYALWAIGKWQMSSVDTSSDT